jgi:hypothetical protein
MPPSERDRQAYSDAYKECVATIRSSSDNYDRTLITIASAFLALPVALIRQISTTRPLEHSRLYLSATAGFVLTILSVLFSYQLGNKVQRCRLVDIKEYYLDGADEALDRKSLWSRGLSITNAVSGVFFVVAIMLTVVFIYLNLGSFQ